MIAASDEACDPPREHPGTGSARPKAGTGGLLEAALTRHNLLLAWKRVKANKGATGVDGLDIEHTARRLRTNWPEIRQALLQGHYRPSPVRKVMIPKPDGSQRELAVKAARAYVQSGKRVVVDVDLVKFFDRVNHGILIDRLGKRIDDAGVIRLIRAYLNAVIMDGGVVERHLGTP